MAQMNTGRARIYICASGVKAGTVISPVRGPRWLGSYVNLAVYEKDGTVKTQFTVVKSALV